MSKHILHIFSTFAVGGPQVRFAALAASLGDKFRNTVIAMDGRYEAAGLLTPGHNTEIGAQPAQASLPGRLTAYRRQICKLSPDLLITYNWGAIEWAMANTLTGVAHVHIADGFGPEEASRQFFRRIWARRLILRGSDVIVPSLVLQDIAEHIWRVPPDRITYIPNGIEPQDDHHTRIGDLGLDIPPETPRIVWAGALRREKNPLRLLQAFAPLKDRAILIIIGDGPEREAVEREAERLSLGSRLRLLGHRSDARDLIMQCQIMALSSDTEQMPLTVLEGMDAGLAIASVDVGDVRHMVAAENRPFIVPASEHALTEALAALISNTGLCEKIGRANRARLRSAFTLDGMAKAYESLFDRMMARPGASPQALPRVRAQ